MSPVHILSQTNLSYTPSHYLKTQFNIILPSAPSFPKWPLSLMSRHQNTLRNSPSYHTCHMIRPSHSSCFITRMTFHSLTFVNWFDTPRPTHTHIYIYMCVCVCVSAKPPDYVCVLEKGSEPKRTSGQQSSVPVKSRH